MTEKPRRRFDSDANFRLDQAELDKASRDSELPPPIADMAREAQDGPRSDTPTLIPCPACSECELCRGAHMVSAQACATFIRGRTLPPEDPRP